MGAPDKEVTIEQLRELPLEKRLELFEGLRESIEREVELIPNTNEFADELEREYQEHLADPSSSIPWETVRERLREKYGMS